MTTAYMALSVLFEVAGLVLCGVVLKGFPQLKVDPNPSFWFLPVISFALAGLFFFLNMRENGFTLSVFIWIGLVTAATLLYGLIILREPMNLYSLLGCGLILLGVLLVQLNSAEA